jgi:hypothetical protein
MRINGKNQRLDSAAAILGWAMHRMAAQAAYAGLHGEDGKSSTMARPGQS